MQAAGLHVQVDEQREQLNLLQDKEMTAERVRPVFDAIDINSDGTVCFEEFTKARAAPPPRRRRHQPHPNPWGAGPTAAPLGPGRPPLPPRALLCTSPALQASSTLLATSFGLSGEALGRELRSRFETADTTGSGALDFDEFLRCDLGLASPMSSLRSPPERLLLDGVQFRGVAQR